MTNKQKHWYSWPTLSAFDNWHNNVIASLNLPRHGHNAATGEIDTNAQATTSYTVPLQIANDDWRAMVEDEIASNFADGLGLPSQPPKAPDEP